MRDAKPLVVDRIRNIRECTFGWVDHNFLHRGFLEALSQPELLLYYFLITVADRHGVSFYDYERICQLLKMPVDDYMEARNRLCARSLIACHRGVFQVLSLPEAGRRPHPCSRREERRAESAGFAAARQDTPQQRQEPTQGFLALKEILKKLSE